MRFDRMPCLGCRSETPFTHRLHEDLIEAGVGRRLDQLDVESPIGVDDKANHSDELIPVFTQVIGQFRQRLRQQTSGCA